MPGYICPNCKKPIYDESSIQSLDWKSHIRQRPGMYIGKLGNGKSSDDGIYVLLKEVIDNSIDEYVMGYGKKSFENEYSLEEAGIVLADIEGRITIDNLKWNGLAKKMGVETGDVISEFKIENLDRPNKATIYPFSLLILLLFGYLNYKRKNVI